MSSADNRPMPAIQDTEFGATKARVSRVGLGTAALGNVYGPMTDDDATELIRHAVASGITYLDTSAYYGLGLSERRVGQAIAPFRDEVFVATKGGRADVHVFDFSYTGIVRQCEASLQRLGVDHVDLYQLHDIEFAEEGQVMEEGLAALRELQRQGKTRFIGVTGYPPVLLSRVAASNQLDSVLSYCHYNLLNRTIGRELVPVCARTQTALVNGSILHMGLLTRAGPPSWHPASQRVRAAARRVVAQCDLMGVSISDVAIAFACAHRPVAVTLLGPNTRDDLDSSIRACHDVPVAEVIEAIWDALDGDVDLSWPSGRAEHHEQ